MKKKIGGVIFVGVKKSDRYWAQSQYAEDYNNGKKTGAAFFHKLFDKKKKTTRPTQRQQQTRKPKTRMNPINRPARA